MNQKSKQDSNMYGKTKYSDHKKNKMLEEKSKDKYSKNSECSSIGKKTNKKSHMIIFFYK